MAPGWPASSYGGPGWTPTQKYIWSEEQARADTVPILPFGIAMVSPVIMAFGTDEQKQKFLPATYNGDIWWCQGYSEPGAGSDLAGLSTRAERIKGDDGKEYYLINGQKTWTTLAQHAGLGLLPLPHRSDCEEAGRHQLHPGGHEDAGHHRASRSSPSTAGTR